MTQPLLGLEEYKRAALDLGCSPALLQAVADVEAPGGGFLPDGRPKLLFERHWFSKLTLHKYDVSNPLISSPFPGGYIGGEYEHTRLAQAAALDRNAALQSASWGRFQIMGFNYKATGCKTLQEFINLMYKSEGAHLALFVNFLRSKGLDKVLQNKNYKKFASVYNGPDYAAHDYDGRIEQAFSRNYGRYA